MWQIPKQQKIKNKIIENIRDKLNQRLNLYFLLLSLPISPSASLSTILLPPPTLNVNLSLSITLVSLGSWLASVHPNLLHGAEKWLFNISNIHTQAISSHHW